MRRKAAYGRTVRALLAGCVLLAAGLAGIVVHYTSVVGEKDRTIAALSSRMAEKDRTIASLNLQILAKDQTISLLNSQVDQLQSRLRSYTDGYERLRKKVSLRLGEGDVTSLITPWEWRVRETVQTITGGWSNPQDWSECWRDIKAMYTWVRTNIRYGEDGPYPVLPHHPSEDLLDFRREVYQFPEETLDLREGDCEDMAILLCSMVRSYTGMKAECIAIKGRGGGHMAVQVPVSGYKLVILDPAGGYYSSDLLGNIVFNSITDEISRWLDYWRGELGSDVRVTRVFSDYIDRTFSSTNDYVLWMYTR